MPGQLTQSIRPSGQGGDFTSLSSWESQNLDLVALDSASYAMIDGNWSGSVDSNQCYINGWTTSITNNVTIECIGTGSRHSGIWDDTKYKLEIEDQVIGCIRNGIPYVTIRGLQVRNYNPTGNGRYGITSEHQTGSVTIDSCIVRGTKSTIYRDSPIFAYSSLYNASAHISNCVVYDLQTFLNTYAGIYVRFAASSPSSSVVNCTVYGNNTGSSGYYLTVCPIKAVNCIAQNCEDGFYFGPGSPIQGFNNVSNVTEAANVNATTGNVLFVDSASYNFQLSPYDTLALGRGISQYTSSYSVTTDIAGTSRGNVSASYFDIGAFHSTQIIRTIKPSGQGGDYSSIVSWESGEQTNLIAVNKSATVYIDGDWTGVSPDDGFRIAGWETDVDHQIYAIVTGSARHNGYYDPNKYVNTNLTYGNPIDLNVAFITIDGFQAKVTGSNTAYLEGIELDGNLNNCENIVKNCIVIDMHSGSGAGANTGIQFGFFTGNKKTGSLYNNIIIGFNRTHGNDSLFHTGIGNYGWPQRYVNNTIVDCYRPFYQNTGKTWVYNTIITGSEAVSYATLTGSHNLSNVDTFGTNQVYGRVQFVNPSNYDYRLSPYDTAVMSKGLNLYTSSFGVSITDDISGISRGNISASNFDIGASHSTKSIRTVKPSGQGGDYTSISSWESSEQKNLIAVNKSAIAYIDGDWSGSMDSPLTIAGWTSNISNSISIIVTGSARHNGYYDETKYVILGTPYVDSIRVPSTELAADCINIYGVQTKGPASNYRRGIFFDVSSDYHTIDSCIISSPVNYGMHINSGYTRVTNCTVINPDTYGIYIYGEDDYFFCTNNTVYSGSAGIALWYSNNNPIYNNICVGQSLASFYNPGPYSTIGTKVGNNISSDGTAWGNNSITSASVLFIDSANYDFRLSPYDTTALGNGINLYTASFGLPISCNVTHDISGISRGNVSASYFDIGASHSTQSIKTIKPSGQGGDYSSLSSWESGEQTNLVAVNKSVVAEITGDWSGSVDSTATVSINGWESDMSHSISIICVGTGSRHNGVWDDTKYVIRSSGTDVIATYENEILIDGLQLESTRTSTNSNVIQVEDAGSSGRGYIYNCIGKMKSNLSNATYFIRTGTGRTMYFKNTIAIPSDYIASGTTGFYLQSANCYLYNCLSYNMGTGFRQQNYSGYAYNCIANACTSSGFLGSAWDGGHSNISNLGDAIGTNPINGSVNFINSSSYNFNLSPYDTVALYKGINVYTSSASVTTDIAGVSRGDVNAPYFDIGPFHCTKSIKTIKPSGQGGDYTSVSSWESAEQKNLISINKSYIAEIGGDWSSTNDSGFGISGWVTGPNNYIKVTTTGTARHNGVWDTSKYWINGGTGASAAYLQNYVTVDGIQGYQTGSGNYFVGVVHFTAGAADAISILENSILKVDSYSKIGSWTACIKGQFANTGSYVVRNCIFTVGDSAYNSVSASRVYCLYSYPKTTFYNCLAIRSKGYGFYEGGAYSMTYYNCIAQDTINGYVGKVTAQSDYNCSDLASDAPGANSVTADLTFQDTSSGNYRLTSADSAVIGTGLDLLSLGYDYAPTTDIVGVTRTSGSWDMGPFAFVSGPTPVPTVYVSARRMAGFFFP